MIDSSLRSSSDDATRLEISRRRRVVGTAAEQRDPDCEPKTEVSPQRSEIDEAAVTAGQVQCPCTIPVAGIIPDTSPPHFSSFSRFFLNFLYFYDSGMTIMFGPLIEALYWAFSGNKTNQIYFILTGYRHSYNFLQYRIYDSCLTALVEGNCT